MLLVLLKPGTRTCTPIQLLTRVSEYDDVTGGDVVRSEDGDLVVERVRDGELPPEDVEEAEGADDLRLHRAERAGRLLEVRELVEEGRHVPGRVLDRDAVD